MREGRRVEAVVALVIDEGGRVRVTTEPFAPLSGVAQRGFASAMRRYARFSGSAVEFG